MNSADRKAILPFLHDVAGLRAVSAGLPGSVPCVTIARKAEELIERFGKKRKPMPLRKREKKATKLSKKERWEAVKEAVARRAGGICECGCGFLLGGDWWRPGGDADHFFGKHRETVETVWQLSRLCHNAKGENRPSREHWDNLFAIHCKKHGYPTPHGRRSAA